MHWIVEYPSPNVYYSLCPLMYCNWVQDICVWRNGQQLPSIVVDSVEVYDSTTDLWSTLAPMSTARSNLTCTAIGSKMFIVGGRDSSKGAIHGINCSLG